MKYFSPASSVIFGIVLLACMIAAAFELDDLFNQMISDYDQSKDKDDASYDLFLTCALNQYFHDGNKRAGQYLMNGSRLVLGLPVVTIAARKSQDYNAKMVLFL